MKMNQQAVNRSPSVAVIEAVASASGQSPLSISGTDGGNEQDGLEPLYETIDPDALNTLFDSNEETSVAVKFMYCGYEVTVESPEQVTVTEK